MINNKTENESQNWKRYGYIDTATNAYLNPFDRGLRDNLQEFLNIDTTTRCRRDYYTLLDDILLSPRTSRHILE